MEQQRSIAIMKCYLIWFNFCECMFMWVHICVRHIWKQGPTTLGCSFSRTIHLVFVCFAFICLFLFCFEVGSVTDPELTEFAKLAGQEASGSQSPVSTSVMLRVKLHIIMSPLFHAGSGNQTQGLMLAPQNLY